MTCPNGHDSQSTDYCDVCGAAMPAAGDTVVVPVLDPDAAPPAEETPVPASTGQDCPNCSTPNAPDALFCEACGYDFTTGTMPRRGEPAATPDPPSNISPSLDDEWVAELWIDPQWYAEQSSPDPLPSAGVPEVVPLRNASLLIGRESKTRDIHPDIDCGTDNGVSRRHAQLTTDGTRWWVEDLASSNGTFVAGAVDPLPKKPIDVGGKREVGPDDRIYVGSWTRLVIRKAAPGEVT
ncbi:MAG: FHA domain-containing protein [Nocardioides sp.]